MFNLKKLFVISIFLTENNLCQERVGQIFNLFSLNKNVNETQRQLGFVIKIFVARNSTELIICLFRAMFI